MCWLYCVNEQCFMATVAAGHGQIEDSLTIHVNSAGVPIALSYELRDDATCMGPRQMRFFQGTIPFGTNVTIIGPSSAVKFVFFLPFSLFFISVFLFFMCVHSCLFLIDKLVKFNNIKKVFINLNSE